jgi:hypothetical protein
MADKSGAGCLKSCAVGCATMFGLFVVLAIGAWMGRDTLRQTGWFKQFADRVETAKSEAVQMNALGARLTEQFPAESIPIRAHIQSENGKTVKALVVTFVNPEFPVPESADGKEAKAREVALAIAADYPTIDRYDQLRLSFVVQRTGGASVGSAAEFQFAIRELQSPPAATP